MIFSRWYICKSDYRSGLGKTIGHLVEMKDGGENVVLCNGKNTWDEVMWKAAKDDKRCIKCTKRQKDASNK